MGDRPTVGLRTLTPPIQVRILFPQPFPVLARMAPECIRDYSDRRRGVYMFAISQLERIEMTATKSAVVVVSEYTDRRKMCCSD